MCQPFCINYTEKDGLSNENVTCISEDQNGYIYIGTSEGVSLFDGVRFTNVSRSGLGDVPKNVFVEKIVFDDNNNLWMSTERNGIYHFNQRTKHWTNLFKLISNQNKILESEVYDISVLDKYLLIAVRNYGLKRINIENLEIDDFEFDSENTFRNIFNSKNGDIILTSFDASYKIHDLFGKHSIDTLFSNMGHLKLITTFEQPDGNQWVTSYTDGLFKSLNGKLTSQNPLVNSDTWRYEIIGLKDAKLFCTFKNVGLGSFDLATQKWDIFTAQPYNRNTLLKGKYNGGLIDSRGIIWIATSKGLSCIYPDLQGFVNINNDKAINEFLLDAHYNNKSKKYVMSYASEEATLKIYDQNFNLLHTDNGLPKDQGINSIIKLIPYEDNYIGLGKSLIYVNGQTGKITDTDFSDLKNLRDLRSALIDNEGNLWLLCQKDRLIKFSLKRKEILMNVTLPYIASAKAGIFILHDIVDCGSKIGIAAQSVFYLVEKNSGYVETFRINSENNVVQPLDKTPAKSGAIQQLMYQDGYIYLVSNEEGIFKIKPYENFSKLVIVSTLPMSELYSPVEMVADGQNRIWVATDNGLALLDLDLNIKKLLKSQDGLSKTKLTQGISLVTNRIFLNGEDGFIVGDPDILAKENKPIKVDIHEVLIKGKAKDTELINASFPYFENDFIANVSMPVYGKIDDYNYWHRLTPYNAEWIKAGIEESSFRYENLPYGAYKFEIKSVVEGNESSISDYSFIIKPPFWKTYWFVSICGLIIITLLTMVYRARVRYKVGQEKLNTRIANLQNEAIRAQLNPHFIFNALNSIRSLILMDKKESSIAYLGNFSHLVREILSISKEANISLAREIDFNKRYVEIERLRFSQSLEFQIHVDESLNTNSIKVPPMIMQPFIENAIWHGLLGKVGPAELKVNISQQGNLLEIIIEDNGKGRNIDKTVNVSSNNKTRKGFGQLLSQERIDTLGTRATLNIIDKMENGNATGTKVIITLPI